MIDSDCARALFLMLKTYKSLLGRKAATLTQGDFTNFVYYKDHIETTTKLKFNHNGLLVGTRHNVLLPESRMGMDNYLFKDHAEEERAKIEAV
jgi:hypothetical protein